MNKRFQPAEAAQNNHSARWMAWGQMPQLPLEWDCVMYPRVSTPKQLGNVSAEMQLEEDGKLMQIACSVAGSPIKYVAPKMIWP